MYILRKSLNQSTPWRWVSFLWKGIYEGSKMKKIVLNISDSTYEKLKFEAIREKKDIPDLISERIFHKPFSNEVEEAFNEFMDQEISKIIGEK